MSYKLLLIVALILSLKSFSQFDPKLLVGKWKLISGKNNDTTMDYLQYFSNGTFKRTRKINEGNKGTWTKDMYYNLGKWKLTDNVVLMYDRKSIPPVRHVRYSDYMDTLVSLTGSELHLITGGGNRGTMYYRKVSIKN